MLLPYNVDRITKRVPYVTYGLMAANILIFFLTILVANLSLAGDREEGKKVIAALVKESAPADMFEGMGEDESEESMLGTSNSEFSNRSQFRRVAPSVGRAARTGNDNAASEEETEMDEGAMDELMGKMHQFQALMIAAKKIETTDDTKRLYLIQHAYDKFVDEPHYSVLNSFAYRPNEPSALQKLFSMFSAMFLHGSLDHLLGNMLFLWIFGRAIEEFLGQKFFLSTYLSAGVAATLLQHIITQNFLPQGMGIPNLGASGAIAGILGLFIVRFYRTKVRIFYLWGWAIWAFAVGTGILSALLNSIIGQPLVSTLISLVVVGTVIFVAGRDSAWGAFRVPSVVMIGIWVVLLNIAPALWQMYSSTGRGGGVAYWAHLGGFACGAVYALLIGGVDQGKDEYALEDAQTALETASSDEAILRAGALLQKDGSNPAAHEIAAQGYDRRKTPELAARHYEKAIEGFWKIGDRNSAARVYSNALEFHPQLPLRPALLLSLSNQYAQNAMWNESAVILTRIVEEFPEAPEAEIALLRAAQLWMKQYDDPAETLRMVEMFRATYPQSEWESQAQGIERAAQNALDAQGN
ncbi:MAG TPA: rhomboid family intramembrane serine protease [Abditibacterium sp.]|jgi:membrane associated rhomboid family serine protease